MYLRLMPNLLHFLPNLDVLYASRCAPNFNEIHPWSFPFKLTKKIVLLLRYVPLASFTRKRNEKIFTYLSRKVNHQKHIVLSQIKVKA
jgi:hypothetical protein